MRIGQRLGRNIFAGNLWPQIN